MVLKVKAERYYMTHVMLATNYGHLGRIGDGRKLSPTRLSLTTYGGQARFLRETAFAQSALSRSRCRTGR